VLHIAATENIVFFITHLVREQHNFLGKNVFGNALMRGTYGFAGRKLSCGKRRQGYRRR